jgi:hypothetical protein
LFTKAEKWTRNNVKFYATDSSEKIKKRTHMTKGFMELLAEKNPKLLRNIETEYSPTSGST